MSNNDSQSDDDLRDDPTVVEYCVNNVTATTRNRLANADASVEARGLPCLERCGTCRRRAFLAVDGELQTAESHGPLLAGLSEVTP